MSGVMGMTSQPGFKSECMACVFSNIFVNPVSGQCSKEWLLDHGSYSKDNMEWSHNGPATDR